MAQHQAGIIVVLAAQAQEIFVQAQCQTQFATDCVIDRLPNGNPEEL